MDGVRRLSVSSRKHGKINQAFSPHEYSLCTLARCARRELSLSLLIVQDAQQRQQMSKNGYLKQLISQGTKGTTPINQSCAIKGLSLTPGDWIASIEVSSPKLSIFYQICFKFILKTCKNCSFHNFMAIMMYPSTHYELQDVDSQR